MQADSSPRTRHGYLFESAPQAASGLVAGAAGETTRTPIPKGNPDPSLDGNHRDEDDTFGHGAEDRSRRTGMDSLGKPRE